MFSSSTTSEVANSNSVLTAIFGSREHLGVIIWNVDAEKTSATSAVEFTTIANALVSGEKNNKDGSKTFVEED